MFIEAGGSVSCLQRQPNTNNYLPRTQASSSPRGYHGRFLEKLSLLGFIKTKFSLFYFSASPPVGAGRLSTTVTGKLINVVTLQWCGVGGLPDGLKDSAFLQPSAQLSSAVWLFVHRLTCSSMITEWLSQLQTQLQA